MATTAPSAPSVVIKPVRGWMPLRLREFVDFRELLFFLVWRDVKVRYKQTALGVTWALLQPALTALIFALLFGRIVGVPSDGVPYPLFALCALVLWTLFAQSVIQGGAQSARPWAARHPRRSTFRGLLVPVAFDRRARRSTSLSGSWCSVPVRVAVRVRVPVSRCCSLRSVHPAHVRHSGPGCSFWRSGDERAPPGREVRRASSWSRSGSSPRR